MPDRLSSSWQAAPGHLVPDPERQAEGDVAGRRHGRHRDEDPGQPADLRRRERQDAGGRRDHRDDERPAVRRVDEVRLRAAAGHVLRRRPSRATGPAARPGWPARCETAKPSSSVEAARRKRLLRRRTSASPRAAIGTNSGPEHHRADHQDLRVQHDGDRREQRREGHEAQVGPVELGLLVRALRDVGPHHGVRAAARGAARPRGRAATARHAPARPWIVPSSVHPDLAQAVDDLVDALAGDVCEHHVALGDDRRAAQDRQAADRRVGAQQLDDVGGELRAHRDPQRHHGDMLPHPACVGAASGGRRPARRSARR